MARTEEDAGVAPTADAPGTARRPRRAILCLLVTLLAPVGCTGPGLEPPFSRDGDNGGGTGAVAAGDGDAAGTGAQGGDYVDGDGDGDGDGDAAGTGGTGNGADEDGGIPDSGMLDGGQ